MKKENIPNYLTLFRIICTPIIIVLGLLSKTHIVIVLAILCALTDLFDGKLARKWNVVSSKGAKMDAVADKIFAIGLLLSLITFKSNLLLILMFEILIATTNLYYYYITNKTKSLMIGKIKTTLLFITIISCMINVYISKISFLTNGFMYATINLQILCLIFYLKYFINNKKILESSVEKTPEHKKIMEETKIDEDTLEVSDLVELAKKYNLYEKEDD